MWRTRCRRNTSLHYPDLIVGPILKPIRPGEEFRCDVARKEGSRYVKDVWTFPLATSMPAASQVRSGMMNRAKIERKSVKMVSSYRRLRAWIDTKVER